MEQNVSRLEVFKTLNCPMISILDFQGQIL